MVSFNDSFEVATKQDSGIVQVSLAPDEVWFIYTHGRLYPTVAIKLHNSL